MDVATSMPAARNCQRCGRILTAAVSIAKGYGPGCRARIRAAAAASAALRDFTVSQIDRARELIADLGIVPSGFAGVFRTVSSTGQEYYLTSPSGCNCRAGLNGRRCYHRAAVIAFTGKAA